MVHHTSIACETLIKQTFARPNRHKVLSDATLKVLPCPGGVDAASVRVKHEPVREVFRLAGCHPGVNELNLPGNKRNVS